MSLSVEYKLSRAAEMRRHQTPPEQFFWDHRRDVTSFQVVRQKLLLGYIADFFIPKVRSIVEIDGKSHEEREEYDRNRDYAFLAARYSVLRLPAELVFKRPRVSLGVASDFIELRHESRQFLSSPTPVLGWAEVTEWGVRAKISEYGVDHYLGDDPDAWHPGERTSCDHCGAVAR